MDSHSEAAFQAIEVLCMSAANAKTAVLPGDQVPSRLSVVAVSHSTRALKSQEDFQHSIQRAIRAGGVAATCGLLIAAGSRLSDAGLAEIASAVAYGRCLQLLTTQGVMTTPTTATLPTSAPLSYVPLFSKCLLGLARCCLDMCSSSHDELLSLRRALLAAKLAQQGTQCITSRGAEATEAFSSLVYDGVELILRACDAVHLASLPLMGGGSAGPLSRTDHTQHTSAYTLWALHAVQSTIDLCAPRYLLWRSRVWAAAWSCQLRAGNAKGAAAVAQHALAACAQLQSELEMDPPVPASTVRLLDHVRFRLQTLGSAAHATDQPQAAITAAVRHSPNPAAALRTALASVLMVAAAAPQHFLGALQPVLPQVGGVLALSLAVRGGLLPTALGAGGNTSPRSSGLKSSLSQRTDSALSQDGKSEASLAGSQTPVTPAEFENSRLAAALPLEVHLKLLRATLSAGDAAKAWAGVMLLSAEARLMCALAARGGFADTTQALCEHGVFLPLCSGHPARDGDAIEAAAFGEGLRLRVRLLPDGLRGTVVAPDQSFPGGTGGFLADGSRGEAVGGLPQSLRWADESAGGAFADAAPADGVQCGVDPDDAGAVVQLHALQMAVAELALIRALLVAEGGAGGLELHAAEALAPITGVTPQQLQEAGRDPAAAADESAAGSVASTPKSSPRGGASKKRGGTPDKNARGGSHSSSAADGGDATPSLTAVGHAVLALASVAAAAKRAGAAEEADFALPRGVPLLVTAGTALAEALQGMCKGPAASLLDKNRGPILRATHLLWAAARAVEAWREGGHPQLGLPPSSGQSSLDTATYMSKVRVCCKQWLAAALSALLALDVRGYLPWLDAGQLGAMGVRLAVLHAEDGDSAQSLQVIHAVERAVQGGLDRAHAPHIAAGARLDVSPDDDSPLPPRPVLTSLAAGLHAPHAAYWATVPTPPLDPLSPQDRELVFQPVTVTALQTAHIAQRMQLAALHTDVVACMFTLEMAAGTAACRTRAAAAVRAAERKAAAADKVPEITPTPLEAALTQSALPAGAFLPGVVPLAPPSTPSVGAGRAPTPASAGVSACGGDSTVLSAATGASTAVGGGAALVSASSSTITQQIFNVPARTMARLKGMAADNPEWVALLALASLPFLRAPGGRVRALADALAALEAATAAAKRMAAGSAGSHPEHPSGIPTLPAGEVQEGKHTAAVAAAAAPLFVLRSSSSITLQLPGASRRQVAAAQRQEGAFSKPVPGVALLGKVFGAGTDVMSSNTGLAGTGRLYPLLPPSGAQGQRALPVAASPAHSLLAEGMWASGVPRGDAVKSDPPLASATGLQRNTLYNFAAAHGSVPTAAQGGLPGAFGGSRGPSAAVLDELAGLMGEGAASLQVGASTPGILAATPLFLPLIRGYLALQAAAHGEWRTARLAAARVALPFLVLDKSGGGNPAVVTPLKWVALNAERLASTPACFLPVLARCLMVLASTDTAGAGALVSSAGGADAGPNTSAGEDQSQQLAAALRSAYTTASQGSSEDRADEWARLMAAPLLPLAGTGGDGVQGGGTGVHGLTARQRTAVATTLRCCTLLQCAQVGTVAASFALVASALADAWWQAAHVLGSGVAWELQLAAAVRGAICELPQMHWTPAVQRCFAQSTFAVGVRVQRGVASGAVCLPDGTDFMKLDVMGLQQWPTAAPKGTHAPEKQPAAAPPSLSVGAQMWQAHVIEGGVSEATPMQLLQGFGWTPTLEGGAVKCDSLQGSLPLIALLQWHLDLALERAVSPVPLLRAAQGAAQDRAHPASGSGTPRSKSKSGKGSGSPAAAAKGEKGGDAEAAATPWAEAGSPPQPNAPAGDIAAHAVAALGVAARLCGVSARYVSSELLLPTLQAVLVVACGGSSSIVSHEKGGNKKSSKGQSPKAAAKKRSGSGRASPREDSATEDAEAAAAATAAASAAADALRARQVQLRDAWRCAAAADAVPLAAAADVAAAYALRSIAQSCPLSAASACLRLLAAAVATARRQEAVLQASQPVPRFVPSGQRPSDEETLPAPHLSVPTVEPFHGPEADEATLPVWLPSVAWCLQQLAWVLRWARQQQLVAAAAPGTEANAAGSGAVAAGGYVSAVAQVLQALDLASERLVGEEAAVPGADSGSAEQRGRIERLATWLPAVLPATQPLFYELPEAAAVQDGERPLSRPSSKESGRRGAKGGKGGPAVDDSDVDAVSVPLGAAAAVSAALLNLYAGHCIAGLGADAFVLLHCVAVCELPGSLGQLLDCEQLVTSNPSSVHGQKTALWRALHRVTDADSGLAASLSLPGASLASTASVNTGARRGHRQQWMETLDKEPMCMAPLCNVAVAWADVEEASAAASGRPAGQRHSAAAHELYTDHGCMSAPARQLLMHLASVAQQAAAASAEQWQRMPSTRGAPLPWWAAHLHAGSRLRDATAAAPHGGLLVDVAALTAGVVEAAEALAELDAERLAERAARLVYVPGEVVAPEAFKPLQLRSVPALGGNEQGSAAWRCNHPHRWSAPLLALVDAAPPCQGEASHGPMSLPQLTGAAAAASVLQHASRAAMAAAAAGAWDTVASVLEGAWAAVEAHQASPASWGVAAPKSPQAEADFGLLLHEEGPLSAVESASFAATAQASLSMAGDAAPSLESKSGTPPSGRRKGGSPRAKGSSSGSSTPQPASEGDEAGAHAAAQGLRGAFIADCWATVAGSAGAVWRAGRLALALLQAVGNGQVLVVQGGEDGVHVASGTHLTQTRLSSGVGGGTTPLPVHSAGGSEEDGPMESGSVSPKNAPVEDEPQAAPHSTGPVDPASVRGGLRRVDVADVLAAAHLLRWSAAVCLRAWHWEDAVELAAGAAGVLHAVLGGTAMSRDTTPVPGHGGWSASGASHALATDAHMGYSAPLGGSGAAGTAWDRALQEAMRATAASSLSVSRAALGGDLEDALLGVVELGSTAAEASLVVLEVHAHAVGQQADSMQAQLQAMLDGDIRRKRRVAVLVDTADDMLSPAQRGLNEALAHEQAALTELSAAVGKATHAAHTLADWLAAHVRGITPAHRRVLAARRALARLVQHASSVHEQIAESPALGGAGGGHLGALRALRGNARPSSAQKAALTPAQLQDEAVQVVTAFDSALPQLRAARDTPTLCVALLEQGCAAMCVGGGAAVDAACACWSDALDACFAQLDVGDGSVWQGLLLQLLPRAPSLPEGGDAGAPPVLPPGMGGGILAHMGPQGALTAATCAALLAACDGSLTLAQQESRWLLAALLGGAAAEGGGGGNPGADLAREVIGQAALGGRVLVHSTLLHLPLAAWALRRTAVALMSRGGRFAAACVPLLALLEGVTGGVMQSYEGVLDARVLRVRCASACGDWATASWHLARAMQGVQLPAAAGIPTANSTPAVSEDAVHVPHVSPPLPVLDGSLPLTATSQAGALTWLLHPTLHPCSVIVAAASPQLLHALVLARCELLLCIAAATGPADSLPAPQGSDSSGEVPPALHLDGGVWFGPLPSVKPLDEAMDGSASRSLTPRSAAKGGKGGKRASGSKSPSTSLKSGQGGDAAADDAAGMGPPDSFLAGSLLHSAAATGVLLCRRVLLGLGAREAVVAAGVSEWAQLSALGAPTPVDTDQGNAFPVGNAQAAVSEGAASSMTSILAAWLLVQLRLTARQPHAAAAAATMAMYLVQASSVDAPVAPLDMLAAGSSATAASFEGAAVWMQLQLAQAGAALATGTPDDAHTMLMRAAATAQERGDATGAIACDLLWAQVDVARGLPGSAIRRLASSLQSQVQAAQQGLPVMQAALVQGAVGPAGVFLCALVDIPCLAAACSSLAVLLSRTPPSAMEEDDAAVAETQSPSALLQRAVQLLVLLSQTQGAVAPALMLQALGGALGGGTHDAAPRTPWQRSAGSRKELPALVETLAIMAAHVLSAASSSSSQAVVHAEALRQALQLARLGQALITCPAGNQIHPYVQFQVHLAAASALRKATQAIVRRLAAGGAASHSHSDAELCEAWARQARDALHSAGQAAQRCGALQFKLLAGLWAHTAAFRQLCVEMQGVLSVPEHAVAQTPPQADGAAASGSSSAKSSPRKGGGKDSAPLPSLPAADGPWHVTSAHVLEAIQAAASAHQHARDLRVDLKRVLGARAIPTDALPAWLRSTLAVASVAQAVVQAETLSIAQGRQPAPVPQGTCLPSLPLEVQPALVVAALAARLPQAASAILCCTSHLEGALSCLGASVHISASVELLQALGRLDSQFVVSANAPTNLWCGGAEPVQGDEDAPPQSGRLYALRVPLLLPVAVGQSEAVPVWQDTVAAVPRPGKDGQPGGVDSVSGCVALRDVVNWSGQGAALSAGARASLTQFALSGGVPRTAALLQAITAEMGGEADSDDEEVPVATLHDALVSVQQQLVNGVGSLPLI